ncbi:hypothetical protein V8E53_014869 [Lactarius tabidus]
MDASSIADIRNTFGAVFVGLLVSSGVSQSRRLGYTTGIILSHCLGDKLTSPRNYHNKDSKALQFFIAFITHFSQPIWYTGEIENEHIILQMLTIVQLITSIVIGVSVEFAAIMQDGFTKASLCFSRLLDFQATICFSTSEPKYYLSGPHLIGIFFATKVITVKKFSSFPTLRWTSCAGMIVGALAELLAATSLCWSLYRKRTGFLGVASTVSFTVSPTSLTWLSLFWAMTKCQINSLLAMLNSRDFISDRPTINADTGYSLSSLRIEPQSEAYMSKSGQPGVSVTVHRSTTSNYGLDKSDHDGETTFKIRKPV